MLSHYVEHITQESLSTLIYLLVGELAPFHTSLGIQQIVVCWRSCIRAVSSCGHPGCLWAPHSSLICTLFAVVDPLAVISSLICVSKLFWGISLFGWSGCKILGSIQGSEQPGVQGVPVCDRGFGTRWTLRSFKTQTILRFSHKSYKAITLGT